MATRSKSNNKELTIEFPDMTPESVFKVLAPIASECGYNVSDMTFGWSIDIKKPMSMIVGYNVNNSNPMFWHPEFTFILQRNPGLI